MKKLIALFAICCAMPVLAGQPYILEYGVAKTITFDLYNTDGTLDVDEVDGGAEVSLICDQAAAATATNDFVDEGSHYSLALTATELQCATLVVEIAATDANNIHITTIGNALAQVDDDGGWFDAVPWNAAWDAEVESEVDDSIGGGTGTSLTGVPYNSAWDADIQSEAADALVAYDAIVPGDLPTNFGDLAITATTGLVSVGTNNDKSGYALAQPFPTNFADLSITATTGRVDIASIAGTAQTANDNGADLNAALVDTNELQTDWVNGGRLDLIVDAVRSQTDQLAFTVANQVDVNAESWNGLAISTALETAADIRSEIDTNSTQLSAIVADTAEIGAAGAGLTGVPYNSAWDVDIQSEAADALAAYDPPTRAELTSDIAGLNDIDAAGVRSAVGMAAANLDTQIAALPTAAEIWDIQCEDQNGGYSCREAVSVLLSEAVGTCVYTTGTRTWVCSDPSGTETRFTLVYGAELDGDRTTSTPAPFTP